MPWLAALVCCSAFDIALHDAYGSLLGLPVYETYDAEHMSRDLAAYLEPAEAPAVCFAGAHPADFLVRPRRAQAARLAPGRRARIPIDAARADGRRARRRLPGAARRLDPTATA